MPDQADAEALARIVAVRPCWTGVTRVGEFASVGGRALFHAGPPYADLADIPPPVMNSLAFGCIYEGWAEDWNEADALLASGGVQVLAAQDHDLLVPLAGVASPTMAAALVADAAGGRARCAVLNEGAQIASRLGQRDDRLVAHHRWLNGELAAWIAGRLAEPIELLPVLHASLEDGDDGHAQTLHGSRRLASELRRRSANTPQRVGSFLEEAAAFALNIWMAAVSVAAAAAEEVPASSLVTRAGGNGHSFGFSTAAAPRRWVISPAPAPRGTLAPEFAGRVPTGALGDSAVLDFFGLGGMNLRSAPAVHRSLQASLPPDVLDRGAAILAGPHPGLGGRRVATSVRRMRDAGKGPIVLLGMIDRVGEAGRIGGGVVDVPAGLFAAAEPDRS